MHNTVSDTQQRGGPRRAGQGIGRGSRWRAPASTPAGGGRPSRVQRVDSRRAARPFCCTRSISMRHEQRRPVFLRVSARRVQALAELYVNGEWLGPVHGGRREIRCPADGSVVTVVSEGTRADTVKAIAAARRAFDDGPWPRTPERERGELLAAHGRPDGPGPGRVRPRRGARHRQAPGRGRVRRRRRGGLLPLLRRRRRHRRRPGDRHRRPGHHQPGGARAGRRLRPDHAVELPPAADVVEGGSRRCWPATRSCSSRAS